MTSTESTGKAEQTDNLTGSLISLITNAQVRYEGTLIEINRNDRSMNLQNVRSFGTEGRRDGKNEIQAHENTIPSVVFKVDHVKDFQIIKRPENEPETPVKNELEEQDPAIISSQQQQDQQESEQATGTENTSTNNNDQPSQQPARQYGSNQPRKGGPPGFNNGETRTLGGGDQPQNAPQRELTQWQRDPKDENPNLRGESGYIHHGQGGGRGRGRGGNNNYRGGRDGGDNQNYRGGRDGGDNQNRQNNSNNYLNNQKIGTIRENPNNALQAKLKDNFDFSQRDLDEQRTAAAQEESKNLPADGGDAEGDNAKADDEDYKNCENDEDDGGAGGFFDNFAKSGSEQSGRGRGRGGARQMREATQQKDTDTFGEQSSENFRYQDNGRRGRGGRGRGNDRGGGRGGRGRGGDGGDGDVNGGFYRQSYSRGGQRNGGYNNQGDNGGRGGGDGYQSRGGGYQGRGGGGDGYQGRGGGYQGRGGGGGYQGRGGYQNNYRGRGNNNNFPRSTGDPLADAKREQQHKERQEM